MNIFTHLATINDAFFSSSTKVYLVTTNVSECYLNVLSNKIYVELPLAVSLIMYKASCKRFHN